MKRGFSLMELLISVALVAIVFAYLYQSAFGLQKTNAFYERKVQDFERHNALIYLLYNDLLKSSQVLPSDPNATSQDDPLFEEKNNFHVLEVNTSNSLKGYAHPYVTYVFDKKQQSLLRLESLSKLKFPLEEKRIKVLDFNRFDQMSDFAVYKNGSDFLVKYNHNKQHRFFQVSKL